eukprot:scaffold18195_cov33-Phaeocystis_antarctica.AAC.3
MAAPTRERGLNPNARTFTYGALASIAKPCKLAAKFRRGRRAPREPPSEGKRGGPRAPRVEFTRASWSKCAPPPHEAHVSNSKDGTRA